MGKERILTTHAGSLPRPDDLIELNRARQAGESRDESAYQQALEAAVADVVRRQRAIGIDLPGDGEYGKAMGHRVNYGAWWSYSFQRLGGLVARVPWNAPARLMKILVERVEALVGHHLGGAAARDGQPAADHRLTAGPDLLQRVVSHVSLLGLPVGSGLTLRHRAASGNRQGRRNVVMQDLTPA